jgi:hypothetical protein
MNKIRMSRAITIALVFALNFSPLWAGVKSYEAHPIFTATYTVPTQQNLAPYATWKLKDSKFIRNNEFVSATYKMPGDLFENPEQEITMTGTIKDDDSFFTMTGDTVSASCSVLGKDRYVCLLRFKKAGLKLQTKNEYFKNLYASANEASGRYSVANDFSGDPVGILKITKQ